MAYRVIMKDIAFEGVLYVVKNSSQIIIHGEKYYIHEKIAQIQQEMDEMLNKMLK